MNEVANFWIKTRITNPNIVKTSHVYHCTTECDNDWAFESRHLPWCRKVKAPSYDYTLENIGLDLTVVSCLLDSGVHRILLRGWDDFLRFWLHEVAWALWWFYWILSGIERCNVFFYFRPCMHFAQLDLFTWYLLFALAYLTISLFEQGAVISGCLAGLQEKVINHVTSVAHALTCREFEASLGTAHVPHILWAISCLMVWRFCHVQRVTQYVMSCAGTGTARSTTYTISGPRISCPAPSAPFEASLWRSHH